jgi:glyoxylase-like metal-dependent hydrolase (beta-lactamase superfamily II)
MRITFSDWCRRVRVAAVVAVCSALSVTHGRSLEPLKAVASQAPASNKLEILEVRPSFFVIVGAGANIGVQVGEDGVVVVDAGSAAEAPAVLAAIKRISAKPIRYVIDTGPDTDHVGGNEALSKAGEKFFSGGNTGGGRNAADSAAPILSAEGVLRHMATSPSGGWPTEVFNYSRQYMYWNGEAFEVLHQAAAHTDSDVFAFFRRSDVVVAGDVLDTRQFPVIDVDRGGSINGEIAALNRLVELIKAGRSLAEVKAAQPAKGYMGRYGNAGGAWTTDRFIEAIYRSLAKEKS